LPADLALPAPGEEFFEMEAAKAFHYRWCDWRHESPILRAKMVAHELIKGMRDTYLLEQRQAQAEGTEGKDGEKRGPAPWDSIREKFFK